MGSALPCGQSRYCRDTADLGYATVVVARHVVTIMNPHEGDEQARSTADAVARRSYGKLVAFFACANATMWLLPKTRSRRRSLRHWRTGPLNGCPSNPEGWLLTVARRKIIDGARRRQSSEQRIRALASDG